MNDVIAAYMLATASAFAPAELAQRGPAPDNWCTPGYKVMVPDGREGRVTSVEGEICRVIADGEAYATLIPHFIVEPVYPQDFQVSSVGH